MLVSVSYPEILVVRYALSSERSELSHVRGGHSTHSKGPKLAVHMQACPVLHDISAERQHLLRS